MAMHLYTIHEHADTPAGAYDPDVKMVREGFSVLAFVFSFLWFLVNRMWREAMLLAVVVSILVFVVAGAELTDVMSNVLRVLLSIIVGVFAHDLQRAHLRRKGYAEIGVASGGNKDEAVLEYMTRPKPSPDAAVPSEEAQSESPEEEPDEK